MSLERLTAALSDRYRLERELGSGGMATVYLAEDLRHSRKVAIKVLREDLAASMGSARFLREIQIAAQLQHPNILPLLDSGDADGFLYYVMPYVPGQSLRERLAREGELPVHEAVRLLCEVTDALAHAHQHGVVHRDVKPDNVMMSGRHALVTDFGVAKAISEATGRNTVTTLGVALGTPTYMSPEQAAADPLVDHRSDLYAVGVMAYEMLTGRPPFTGATPQQVLAAHVTEAPDPVSRRRQAIPPALEQIVMRCLAKRPADRYQTAEELLHALEAQATPSLGVTPTTTRPVPAWRAPHSRRWLVAGLAITAAGVATLLVLGRGDPAGVILNAPRRQVTFTGTAELAVALAPDGQRIAYGDRACDDDHRCTYDLVVQDVDGAGQLRVVRGLQAIYWVRWSGDGRTLVYAGLQAGSAAAVHVVPALGGVAPRFLTNLQAFPFGNGDSIAIGVASDPTRLGIVATTLLDPTRGDTSWIARDGVDQFSWGISKDGRWILVEDSRGSAPSSRVFVHDRGGRLTDSLDLVNPVAGGFRSTEWLVVGTLDDAEQGLVTVREHRIDARGRFTGEQREVISQVPMRGLAIGAGGMAYLAGTTQSTAVALSRDRAEGPLTTRNVTSSTGELSALMSSDGASVILVRTRIEADGSEITQLAVQPFEGGPERSLGAGIRDVVDRSRTTDGRAMVVLAQEGGTRRIIRIDLADGARTDLGSVADTSDEWGLEVLHDGSLAWQPAGDPTAIRIRAPDGTIRSVPTPRVRVQQMEDSPWGFGLVGWGFSEPAQDSIVVFHLPPGAGAARSVLRTTFDYVPGLRWTADGEVELAVNETLATSALYRLDPATGALRRLGTIPANFVVGLSFSNDGLRLIARTQEPTHDVWVVRWE